jgi:hypothetical protein
MLQYNKPFGALDTEGTEGTDGTEATMDSTGMIPYLCSLRGLRVQCSMALVPSVPFVPSVSNDR